MINQKNNMTTNQKLSIDIAKAIKINTPPNKIPIRAP